MVHLRPILAIFRRSGLPCFVALGLLAFGFCYLRTAVARLMIYYGGNELVTRQANGARNTSNNNNSSTRGGGRAWRGDLAIHGMIQRQRTAILDFVIINTDAPSYGHQPSL